MIAAYIADIRRAVEGETFYCALAMAVTLPDICGRIEYPEASDRTRYLRWFNQWCKGLATLFMTAEDCYALRCTYLHQGRDFIAGQRVGPVLERLHFSAGATAGVVKHQAGDQEVGLPPALQIPVEVFCDRMCAGAEAWLESRQMDTRAAAELAQLLRIRTPSEPFS